MSRDRYAIQLEIATVENVLHDIGVEAISVKTIKKDNGGVLIEIIGELHRNLLKPVGDKKNTGIGFSGAPEEASG